MFYNHLTETNINVYEKLISDIKSILTNEYNVYEEDKLEDATSHTIEQLIKTKKKFNKQALSDTTIRKAIKFSSLSLLRKDIKCGLVTKQEVDGDTIYTRDVNIVSINNEEDDKSVIENLGSIETDFNSLDIHFMIKHIQRKFDTLTGKVMFYQLQQYKNKEIAEMLNIDVKKVENTKTKIKKYLKENKDKFID